MAINSLFSPIGRRLEGKVAVITGGASGIGACTARLFNQHGAKVVIADINDQLGQSVSKDLGPQASSFVHCDVTDESDVQNTVDLAVSKYGKLDIMFNNAGIIKNHQNILDTRKSDFEKVLCVNATGVFLGIKHAARVMIPLRCGSIINTSSIAAWVGGITAHGYTSSKSSVTGLTKNAAVELGRFGIRVNSVAPYAVATSMCTTSFNMTEADIERRASAALPLKGVVIKAEDIANAVLYLASDEARYVSGHDLVIDGAYSITNLALIDALSA